MPVAIWMSSSRLACSARLTKAASARPLGENGFPFVTSIFVLTGGEIRFRREVSRRSTPKAPPHCRKTFFHIPGDEIFLQQLVGELHLVAQADDARAGRQILPAGAEDSGHFSQGQHGLRIAVFPRGAPADSSPAE